MLEQVKKFPLGTRQSPTRATHTHTAAGVKEPLTLSLNTCCDTRRRLLKFDSLCCVGCVLGGQSESQRQQLPAEGRLLQARAAGLARLQRGGEAADEPAARQVRHTNHCSSMCMHTIHCIQLFLSVLSLYFHSCLTESFSS